MKLHFDSHQDYLIKCYTGDKDFKINLHFTVLFLILNARILSDHSMKLLSILLILFSISMPASGQNPFILTLEQPEVDIISDVVQISERFYFIQNRLVDLFSGSGYNAYSDLLITSENGSIIEQYNLDGFRAHYERILKVTRDDIYLVGYIKSDSCLSKLVISKFNIHTHTLDHISSYDFCENKIETLNIVKGLSQRIFIEGSFSIPNHNKFIINMDSTYTLTPMFDDLTRGFTLSVDFSRTGYLIAESRIYNFYDADFNFRKQAWFYEDADYPYETHKPFGNHLILVHSVQHRSDYPDQGIQIMLIDSSLKVKKKAVIFQSLPRYIFMSLPFFGGIDIKNENEIWASGEFQLHPPSFDTSFYSITKLDSNLNIICQHFIGYDTKYRIFGIRALESGGAIVHGNRVREGHGPGEGEDIYAIRVGENCELPTTSTNGPQDPLISISAYPNPGINDLTFSINGFDPATLQVELIDELGQVLFTAKDLTNSIAVPELPAGQYFYRIMQKERLLGVGSWVKE